MSVIKQDQHRRLGHEHYDIIPDGYHCGHCYCCGDGLMAVVKRLVVPLPRKENAGEYYDALDRIMLADNTTYISNYIKALHEASACLNSSSHDYLPCRNCLFSDLYRKRADFLMLMAACDKYINDESYLPETRT